MLAFWGAVEVRHGLGWATKGPLWTACLLRLVALLLVSVILLILLLLACAFFSLLLAWFWGALSEMLSERNTIA